ncbi:MAG: hypothetical protein J0I34_07350 [Pseudonocardia sp.]|uniref:hypothetical protein n=1 Tax=Actinomycetes TaxID=1760 RepID=UPI00086C0A79|nr:MULTISPECIES: hypothetical protein [Actinomycetes]MBN9108583.1 hypothetical protein [Pseudonocardia sp.]ODU27462.1 MAG: hypothetical protein ABS80_03535 [Pseudonocardia sp. SCN 72-51]ODV07776.1 MAG: hypothetical protein ABT15_06785 [Pseudonocardia sp. SCN 73-27]
MTPDPTALSGAEVGPWRIRPTTLMALDSVGPALHITNTRRDEQPLCIRQDEAVELLCAMALALAIEHIDIPSAVDEPDVDADRYRWGHT